MSDSLIDLGYGAGTIRFEYDADSFAVLAPDAHDEPLGGEDLAYALDAPIESPPLEEIVDPAERVLVVADASRTAGIERIASLLLLRLSDLGVPDENISVLLGGFHTPPSEDELRSIVGPAVADRVALSAHDPDDSTAVTSLGETTRGTSVEVDRRLVEADHVILVGAIGFHPVAGFTGGRDAIVPGCASARAIAEHESLAVDPETNGRRAGVGPGRLDGNAIHEDREEAARTIEPSFLVNTVLDAETGIVRIYAGDWRHAHRRGCAEYSASHAVSVPERRPLVVVSCGGAPYDADLAHALAAIEYAAGVVEDGGAMVVLAECGSGLDALRVDDGVARTLRARAERIRVFLISGLEPEAVRDLGLEPHASLDSALASAGSGPGYVVPFGTTTLPYVGPTS